MVTLSKLETKQNFLLHKSNVAPLMPCRARYFRPLGGLRYLCTSSHHALSFLNRSGRLSLLLSPYKQNVTGLIPGGSIQTFLLMFTISSLNLVVKMSAEFKDQNTYHFNIGQVEPQIQQWLQMASVAMYDGAL